MSHKSFNSIFIQFPKHTSLSNSSRSIIDKLICSDINSTDGIRLSLDTPLNNPPMLNILRPAVLRQYYSLNIEHLYSDINIIRRYTYGSGTGSSSVGMDPRNFVTKVMSEEMSSCQRSYMAYFWRIGRISNYKTPISVYLLTIVQWYYIMLENIWKSLQN